MRWKIGKFFRKYLEVVQEILVSANYILKPMGYLIAIIYEILSFSKNEDRIFNNNLG